MVFFSKQETMEKVVQLATQFKRSGLLLLTITQSFNFCF